MPVRAGVKPAKTQGLAGSFDLIIVLVSSICPSKSLLPLLHPALCPKGTETEAMPWRTAKDLLGQGSFCLLSLVSSLFSCSRTHNSMEDINTVEKFQIEIQGTAPQIPTGLGYQRSCCRIRKSQLSVPESYSPCHNPQGCLTCCLSSHLSHFPIQVSHKSI